MSKNSGQMSRFAGCLAPICRANKIKFFFLSFRHFGDVSYGNSSRRLRRNGQQIGGGRPEWQVQQLDGPQSGRQ